MKPKQLSLIVLRLLIAVTCFAQSGKDISERLTRHDTSLVLFKRSETNKYIVAAAIKKATLMYYLIDRYGSTIESFKMTPADCSVILQHQSCAFDYYPAYIKGRNKFRNEIINDLRDHKKVLPESPCYDAALFYYPEIVDSDSSSSINGIVRLEKENMRDSLYLCAFNINDPKKLLPGLPSIHNDDANAGTYYKVGDTLIFTNHDKFARIHLAVLDTKTSRLKYYSRSRLCVGTFDINPKIVTDFLKTDIFDYYLQYIERAKQMADNRVKAFQSRPVQFTSLPEGKDAGLAAALIEQRKIDTNTDFSTSPDLVWFAGELKKEYSNAAINVSWLRFLGISYDTTPASWDSVGTSRYELDDHRGNVMATITDKRIQNGSPLSYFTADVATADDYYPFGMPMPDRQYRFGSDSTYRYGFNGKENDNLVKGFANQVDYGNRIYDPRAGSFLSVDPITKSYPQLTPYQFASNTPIQAVDIDGLELYNVYLKTYQDSKGNARFQIERTEMVDDIVDAIGIASRGGQNGVSLNYIYKGSEIEILDPTKKDVLSFWRNITPSNFEQVAQKINEAKVDGVIKSGLVRATLAAFDEYASTNNIISRQKVSTDAKQLTAGSNNGFNLSDVNPLKGKNNCVNCSLATDNYLKGRPASALNSSVTPISVIEKEYNSKFVNGLTIDQIKSMVPNNGDTGIVFGNRGVGKVGHVFNVINQNGIINFVDGQSNKGANLSGYKDFSFISTTGK